MTTAFKYGSVSIIANVRSLDSSGSDVNSSRRSLDCTLACVLICLIINSKAAGTASCPATGLCIKSRKLGQIQISLPA